MKPFAFTAISIAASVNFASAAVVEYFDFENASNTSNTPIGDGVWFTNTDAPRSEANGTGGTLGVNGSLLRGWNQTFGPQFDADRVNPNGGSFSMDTVDSSGDGYMTGGALHNWTSTTWTMQLHFFVDTINGFETLVGRDGSSYGNAESDFYLQLIGGSNEMRLNYRDTDGDQIALNSSTVITAGQWWGVSVVADSVAQTVTMYLDDGTGYSQEAQLTGITTGDLGVTSSNLGWTVGRGWFDGNFVDGMDASFDNWQIDDTALSMSELTVVPEPTTFLLGALGMLGLLRRRR